ncbi:MAG: hypothetical protein AAB036_01020 [Elusimicrobiota bacterium]
MTIPLGLVAALTLAAASAADLPTTSGSTPPAEPVAALTVSLLKDRFTEAVDIDAKNKILVQIAKTSPTTSQDVSALFDLFSRFPDNAVRKAVMDSLALIPPDSPQIEPLFITYLKEPEQESQLFGINGAFRVRSRQALPLIRAIANRKFAAPNATETTVLSERNAWWTQFEALSVLAQWEGDKALSLLRKKSLESPAIGRLLGRFYWKQTLPQLKEWSLSSNQNSRERAVNAASASIEPADARATREEMLAIMRDSKVDRDVRHQLALKVGLSSTDEEIEALLGEHDAVKNDSDRLFWAAALFISRNPKIAPLLVRYARNTSDDALRLGATSQLEDMFGPAEASRMIEGDKKK